MKHLVILSYGASGTNVLVDQLFNNKHIDVHLYKEPLCMKKSRNSKLKNGLVTWKQHIEQLIKKTKDKKLLIHIKPQHFKKLGVSLEEGIDYLKDTFDFIFVERKNYLARMSSAAFKPRSKYRITETQVHVNANLDRLKKMSKINATLKYLIKDYNHICLTYEDHINPGPRIAADMITKYFNIYHDYDYKNYRVNYHTTKNKYSDVKLCDKIINFGDLVDEFTDTTYYWMLWE